MPESLNSRRVPRVGYAYTIGGALLGLAVASFAIALWRQTLSPLQHFYAWSYLKYAVEAQLPTLPHRVNHALTAYEYLRRDVFENKAAFNVFRPVLGLAWSCPVLAAFVGMIFDAKRLNDFRCGKKLRGWDVLTPRQFNHQTKGDGFALQIER